MIGNIITPFLTAHTAEEAKNILKTEAKLPDYVYKGLFQKVSKFFFIIQGLMNALPNPVRKLMKPEKFEVDP